MHHQTPGSNTYVLVGNPLTLAVIEFFAVPGALFGTLLYPLGLDGWVWAWVGLGIRFIFWAAGFLASAPASTLHLPAFAPWALPCLTLALLSVVVWRTTLMRWTALPWLALGLWGAASGQRYDLIIAPTGDLVAIRGADGSFGVLGRSNAFTAEQWLAADGDSRAGTDMTASAPAETRCDKLACVAPVVGGQTLSVVSDAQAFEDDCRRASIIVTPLYAPASCGAELIIDRGSLAETGALGLTLRHGGWISTATRTAGEDRPWSPAPKPWGRPSAGRDQPPSAGDAEER